jgi:CHAT domain-containing protein
MTTLIAQSSGLDTLKRNELNFYGNQDYEKGYELRVNGASEEARVYLERAFEDFIAAQNWEAAAQAGGHILYAFSGTDDPFSGIERMDSLASRIKKQAPEHLDDCRYLYYGATHLYLNNNKPHEAIHAAHQALSALKSSNDPYANAEYMKAYGNLGYSYIYLRNIDSASYYMNEAYRSMQQYKNYSINEAGEIMQALGRLEAQKGNYGKAANFFEQGIDYIENTEGTPNWAIWRLYAELGFYYFSMLEYEKSAENLKKSISVLESQEGLPPVYYYNYIPSQYFSTCNAYLALNDIESATEYFEKGVEYEKNDPVAVEKNPHVINYRGKILLHQGKAREALQEQQKALKIYSKWMNNSPPEEQVNFKPFLNSLTANVGLAYQELGQLDSAIYCFHQTLEIGGITQLTEIQIYEALTQLHLQKEQPDSALFYNQLALEKSCNGSKLAGLHALLPAHAFKSTTEVYSLLRQRVAALQLPGKQARLSESTQLALQAMELSDTLHHQNLAEINLIRAAQSKTIINESIINYQLSLSLAQELYEQAPTPDLLGKSFYFTQMMKSQGLWLALLESEARRFGGLDKQLLETERDLLAEIHFYETQLQQAAQQENADLIAYYENEKLYELKREYVRFKKQLEQSYPEYYASKYNFIPESALSLQSVLQEKELLIEYAFCDSILFAFTLSKGQSLAVDRMPVQPRLMEQINTLMNKLQHSAMSRKSSRAEFIRLSHLLYQQFIAPIEERLSGHSRLIIIGDGITHFIPFETLLASDEILPFEKLEYLIKQYEISYHYSSTLFAKSRKEELNRHSGIYAFAPVYDQQPGTAYSTDKSVLRNVFRALDGPEKFPPLPASEHESKEIVDAFEQQDITDNRLDLRMQATEASLKEAMNLPYRFIHIAGHSFADLENPKFSGIACYQEAQPDSSAQRSEDGILYTSEIYNLQLQADLITLSSCESGFGKLDQAEGILGLNRAFIYSGAPNVVFSLWKVYDKVSSQLMVDFYREVLNGVSYSTSLRKAKLELLKKPKTAAPHYWSPYLLIGR